MAPLNWPPFNTQKKKEQEDEFGHGSQGGKKIPELGTLKDLLPPRKGRELAPIVEEEISDDLNLEENVEMLEREGKKMGKKRQAVLGQEILSYIPETRQELENRLKEIDKLTPADAAEITEALDVLKTLETRVHTVLDKKEDFGKEIDTSQISAPQYGLEKDLNKMQGEMKQLVTAPKVSRSKKQKTQSTKLFSEELAATGLLEVTKPTDVTRKEGKQALWEQVLRDQQLSEEQARVQREAASQKLDSALQGESSTQKPENVVPSNPSFNALFEAPEVPKSVTPVDPEAQKIRQNFGKAMLEALAAKEALPTLIAAKELEEKYTTRLKLDYVAQSGFRRFLNKFTNQDKRISSEAKELRKDWLEARAQYAKELLGKNVSRSEVVKYALLDAVKAEQQAKIEGLGAREKTAINKFANWYQGLDPAHRIFGTSAVLTLASAALTGGASFAIYPLAMGSISALARYGKIVAQNEKLQKAFGITSAAMSISTLGYLGEYAVKARHFFKQTELKADIEAARQRHQGNLEDVEGFTAAFDAQKTAATAEDDIARGARMARILVAVAGGLAAGEVRAHEHAGSLHEESAEPLHLNAVPETTHGNVSLPPAHTEVPPQVPPTMATWDTPPKTPPPFNDDQAIAEPAPEVLTKDNLDVLTAEVAKGKGFDFMVKRIWLKLHDAQHRVDASKFAASSEIGRLRDAQTEADLLKLLPDLEKTHGITGNIIFAEGAKIHVSEEGALQVDDSYKHFAPNKAVTAEVVAPPVNETVSSEQAVSQPEAPTPAAEVAQPIQTETAPAEQVSATSSIPVENAPEGTSSSGFEVVTEEPQQIDISPAPQSTQIEEVAQPQPEANAPSEIAPQAESAPAQAEPTQIAPESRAHIEHVEPYTNEYNTRVDPTRPLAYTTKLNGNNVLYVSGGGETEEGFAARFDYIQEVVAKDPGMRDVHVYFDTTRTDQITGVVTPEMGSVFINKDGDVGIEDPQNSAIWDASTNTPLPPPDSETFETRVEINPAP